jgi:hypothetical protein
MVGSEGFEPPQRDPKSPVLPLDELPMEKVANKIGLTALAVPVTFTDLAHELE